jgi:hypothetical protein
VLPAPRVPDGLTITLFFEKHSRTRRRRDSPDNGQVERMNRTTKEATVKRYYYQSHDQLKQHPHTFLTASNFAKRLKTLKGLALTNLQNLDTQPKRFTINPFQQNVGLNS